jgi:hypothetical protein
MRHSQAHSPTAHAKISGQQAEQCWPAPRSVGADASLSQPVPNWWEAPTTAHIRTLHKHTQSRYFITSNGGATQAAARRQGSAPLNSARRLLLCGTPPVPARQPPKQGAHETGQSALHSIRNNQPCGSIQQPPTDPNGSTHPRTDVPPAIRPFIQRNQKAKQAPGARATGLAPFVCALRRQARYQDHLTRKGMSTLLAGMTHSPTRQHTC